MKIKTIDQIVIAQGEDRVISLPILNEDGSVHSLTSATEIIVATLVSNKVQTKFSLTSRADYGRITIGVSPNENVLNLLLRRGHTKGYQVGSLKVVILIEEPDATMNNKRTEIVYELGSVVSGSLVLEEMSMFTPSAPTLPVTDDTAKTFSWTNVIGFTEADDYEISVNGGTSWTPVAVKPTPIVGAHLAGQVKVRVRQNLGTDTSVGAALANNVAFT